MRSLPRSRSSSSTFRLSKKALAFRQVVQDGLCRNLILAFILILSGSVDILVTTMKIRDIGRFEIVVSYRGRRCDGRSRTPALCSHRPASLHGGAPALPKPIQQTP